MELLKADGITKRFGGLTANKDVSLRINQGEIVSIIGPNGAGKTTLFNLITGVEVPDSGVVMFADQEITRMPSPKIARMGLVRTFQQTKIFRDISVIDAVVTGRHLHDKTTLLGALFSSRSARKERAQSYQKAMKILEFLDMSERYTTKTQNLPYGEQKMLNIAIALAAEPQLLLLDEPAAGMNPKESLRLMETIGRIKSLGITVGLVEHNMRLVMKISEKIFVLNYGEVIAEGNPEAIRNNKKVVEVYLGRQKSA
ncbi:ABC transporter ATP-binding protein [Desulfosarcina sp.]|uniref:ABC transporter ATP-binding protein n=1 Tax=Desulfosarcina sp. TaxID=2027861 RepID=UPI003970AC15